MTDMFQTVDEEPEEGFLYVLKEPELDEPLGYFPPDAESALKHWEARGIPSEIVAW